eukprot:Skav202873  [mRNA]  locus=scaffold3541:131472:132857:- [translate_table: standard]
MYPWSTRKQLSKVLHLLSVKISCPEEVTESCIWPTATDKRGVAMETVWWLSSRVQWLEQGQAQMRSEFCKHLEHFTTEAVLKSMSVLKEELHQDVKQSAAHLLNQVRTDFETKGDMTHAIVLACQRDIEGLMEKTKALEGSLQDLQQEQTREQVRELKEQLREQDVSLRQQGLEVRKIMDEQRRTEQRQNDAQKELRRLQELHNQLVCACDNAQTELDKQAKIIEECASKLDGQVDNVVANMDNEWEELNNMSAVTPKKSTVTCKLAKGGAPGNGDEEATEDLKVRSEVRQQVRDLGQQLSKEVVNLAEHQLRFSHEAAQKVTQQVAQQGQRFEVACSETINRLSFMEKVVATVMDRLDPQEQSLQRLEESHSKSIRDSTRLKEKVKTLSKRLSRLQEEGDAAAQNFDRFAQATMQAFQHMMPQPNPEVNVNCWQMVGTATVVQDVIDGCDCGDDVSNLSW